tara:strand:+ start:4862 stop:5005 length:144 start_codon:yes stop_codon:yes gene_type:complete
MPEPVLLPKGIDLDGVRITRWAVETGQRTIGISVRETSALALRQQPT